METVVAGMTEIALTMKEFQANVMPSTFVPAVPPYTGTWVWGYRAGLLPTNPAGTYIGPVVVATRDQPTQMRFTNNLGDTMSTKLTAWTTSTDQTLHWADPKGEGMAMPMTNYAGPIPAVPHLHGGEVPPELDGGPDAWFLSSPATGYMMHGHAYYSMGDVSGLENYCVYRYPNTQQPAPIWFHDHVLGATRLNVYAGLAGAYLIIDPAASLPPGLDPLGLARNGVVSYTVPLVIQDRMFDVNGQLFFPNFGINPMTHPFWIPEFLGDTIVVNGKVWPYHAVDRQRYRFLFLNGSNARGYDMLLQDPISGVKGPKLWVIGTDGGYLDNPVQIDPNSVNKAVPKSLVMLPGERYDVIVDFGDPAGSRPSATRIHGNIPNPLNLTLINNAKAPYPGGAPAPSSTIGRILQFRVSNVQPQADTSFNPAAAGATLRTAEPLPPIVRLVNNATGAPAVTPTITRQLTLNEVMGPGGPLEVLVNNTKWTGESVATDVFPGGMRPDFVVAGPDSAHYSEIPDEGDTELWEIINLTVDAHPIHLHLVSFQLMNRQRFDVKGYTAAYNALFPGSAAIDPMTGLPSARRVHRRLWPPATTTPVEPREERRGLGLYGRSHYARQGREPGCDPVPQQEGAAVPRAHEQGWKDTVIALPGQVTRFLVRWAPNDGSRQIFPFNPNSNGHGYVWHCHIIDHEDNEMMRPSQSSRRMWSGRTCRATTTRLITNLGWNAPVRSTPGSPVAPLLPYATCPPPEPMEPGFRRRER